jgi:stage III sporulation protein AG
MKIVDVKEAAFGLFKKYKYFFIVLGAGLALILFSSLPSDADRSAVPEEPAGFVLEDYQRQLEDTLSRVKGVGRVSVMLTLKNNGEALYAEDTRQSINRTADSYDSDTQKNVVTVNESGRSEPVVVSKSYPEFQGVVVVCEGADSSSVRYELTLAMAALTGIPTQNICILKMKS